jgi:hypothetical protein
MSHYGVEKDTQRSRLSLYPYILMGEFPILAELLDREVSILIIIRSPKTMAYLQLSINHLTLCSSASLNGVNSKEPISVISFSLEAGFRNCPSAFDVSNWMVRPRVKKVNKPRCKGRSQTSDEVRRTGRWECTHKGSAKGVS